ncbi:CCA tRNA nucleotidyltransferase [Bdellovibrionota bacterium]
MIDPSHIADFPLKVVQRLQKAGYETYLVGGCVRDLLVGRTPKDFDIATAARPNDIRRIVRRGRLIGKRFKLILVRDGGNKYEIATFRSSKMRVDRRGRRDFNIFGNPKEDAQRRDFTINALFYDPKTEKVLDYVGGREDLHRHLLRSIRRPSENYEEDSIRILRGLRIAGKLKLDIAEEDYHEMVVRRNLLADASKDRIREEVFKALKEGTMTSFCQQMIKSGVVEYVFPVACDYGSNEIEDLIVYLQSYDDNLPFKDFELGVLVVWLPLAKRILRDSTIQINSVAEVGKQFKFLRDLKALLRYSGQFTGSIAQVYYYWFQIRGRWIEDGVPETRKHQLHYDPHFFAALQLALLEEELLGEETPVMQWIKKEIQACSKPKSIRHLPAGHRRGTTQQPRRQSRFSKRGRKPYRRRGGGKGRGNS